MRKIHIAMVLLVGTIVCIAAACLLKRDFGQILRDDLTEQYGADPDEYGSLTVLENVHPAKSMCVEKKVRLKSDYAERQGQPAFRQITLQVPEGFQDKIMDDLYQFVAQNITCRVNISNSMAFNVEARLILLQKRLDAAGIRYDPKWFDVAKDMLASETDEALLNEALSVKLDDIATAESARALYKAALFESLRCSFGPSKEPSVFHAEDSNLYVFPSFSGPQKVTMDWSLYKGGEYHCSGSFAYQCDHNYSKRFFTEAVNHLTAVLGVGR